MNIEEIQFSSENTYRFTEKISFPRLFGSKGNKKVRQMIKETLEEYDLKVYVHNFIGSFSKLVFMRNLLLTITAVQIIFQISYLVSPLLNIILSIGMVFFIRFLVGYASKYDTSKTKRKTKDSIGGENIYTIVKATDDEVSNPKTLIFMAHYDTKSQGIGIMTRVGSFMVLYFSGLIAPLMIVLGSIYGIIFGRENRFLFRTSEHFFLGFSIQIGYYDYFTIFLSTIVTSAALVNILCYSTTGNESPGSIDNGTSLSTVIELARIFRISPPRNINLVFLCTDAEEVGLIGSSAFVEDMIRGRNIETDGISLQREDTYVVNYELLGLKDASLGIEVSHGFLSKTYTTPELNEYIFKAAKEMDENMNLVKVHSGVGAVADHIGFLNKSFKTTMFIPSLSSSRMNWIHTKNDDMKLVSKEKLGEVGSLCQHLVIHMDQELGRE